MSAGEVTQVLVGFGALVAFLTGFSSLRQRQRLEYIRESVRTANERLEDLAERQDALPLPVTAIDQELRPASTDPLGALVITLSVLTAGAVGGIWWRAIQEATFASQGTAALFSTLAVTLIAVTAGVGVFDVGWGRRQIRISLQYSTARHAAVALLRFVIIGRLILVQQLHRSLVMRLDPTDASGAPRDAEILRRIAQLPGLLGGAGVPPWVIARARRRADKALTSGLTVDELPHRPGLDDLEEEATRASLVLRQLRPSAATWASFSAAMDELRRRLPEWEWIDLLAAWIAAGLTPTSDAGQGPSTAAALDRLHRVDYQRALGIHSATRETDSRDLAAWSIAEAIERRAALLDATGRGPGSGEAATLWDVHPASDASEEREGTPVRTTVAGFRARDPFVWLALTEPSVADASAWVGDHFVFDDEVRWRRADETRKVIDSTAGALAASPRSDAELHRELDGALMTRVISHPINDVNPLIAMRMAGASDLAELFQRYTTSDPSKGRPQRAPIVDWIEHAISPLRWFGAMPRRMQVVMVVVAAAIIALFNAR